MIKKVTFYGISTSVSRGTALLCLPLLTNALSLSEFGLYSIVQVVVLVVSEILNLGGVVAVLREGGRESGAGYKLLRDYSLISITISALLIIAVMLFASSTYALYMLVALIACAESIHNLILAYLRSMDYENWYFTFASVKSFGILTTILASIYMKYNLQALLICQLFVYVMLAIISMIIIYSNHNKLSPCNISILKTLPYSLFLIPHGVSQWILSGSDRLIIKKILDSQQVGIYSIAYTLSMVIMLLNSGLALALPQHLFQNYDTWLNTNIRAKLIKMYSFATILIFIGVQLYLKLDRAFLHYIKYYQRDMPLLIGLISSGLYLLGVYYFYVNYIFYHKKTKNLACITAITSIINVSLTFVLVNIYGIVGAAI
ncbi:MAG TPA: oligosaccharide flippase family protein, partial [Clostridia bacterium]